MLFGCLLLLYALDCVFVKPVRHLCLELFSAKFIFIGMKHNLPRFSLIIPRLSINLLIQLYFLFTLPLNLIFILLFSVLYEFNYSVANKTASVNYVVENGEAKVLQMDSDLMGSSSDGVALYQRRVSCLVVPNLLKKSLAVFNILLQLILFIFRMRLYSFFLFTSFLLDQLHFFSIKVSFFVFFIFQLLLFLLNFSCNFINSIFMRNAFNVSRQFFVLPLKITINSCKIHLLHRFLPTFFMKKNNVFLVFRKNQQSTRSFIQSVQNIDILESILVFKKTFDRIEVMTSASMHNNACRFINNQKFRALVYNVNRQIQNRRLNPNRDMSDLITILQNIVSRHLFSIDCDSGIVDSVFVILRWIGFELLYQSVQELFADPSAFCEGFVGVGIRLYESEWESMNVLGLLLFVCVFLHLQASFSFIIES